MQKNLVFGTQWQKQLAYYDPKSCLLKTYQMRFTWAEPTCLEVLPKSGMMRSGKLYEVQPLLEHPTAEKGGFAYPTPQHRSYKNTPSTPAAWQQKDDLATAIAREEGYNQQTIGKNARIHPHFIEWLLGFPEDYTQPND